MAYVFPTDSHVHTLWIGQIPRWVHLCVDSYARTGHEVQWWLYQEEQPHLANMKLHPKIRFRDANEILNLPTAHGMYFYGIGTEAKYKGWAPFSDWFRCEVIYRHGGWWVDADSFNVRGLRDVGNSPFIVCTERHRRGDRRLLGVVGVPPPYPTREHDRDDNSCDLWLLPSGKCKDRCCSLAAFYKWSERVNNAGADVCLVTNNHFRARPGNPTVLAIGKEIRSALDQYAKEVEERGKDNITVVDRRGYANCALPQGTFGMKLFQKHIKLLLASAPRSVSVLHFSVFNPVDATDADRMFRVFNGEETVCGQWVKSIHIFREVRDAWSAKGNVVPQLLVKTSDENPLVQPNKRKHTKKKAAANHALVPRPVGPLLKRRRAA